MHEPSHLTPDCTTSGIDSNRASIRSAPSRDSFRRGPDFLDRPGTTVSGEVSVQGSVRTSAALRLPTSEVDPYRSPSQCQSKGVEQMPLTGFSFNCSFQGPRLLKLQCTYRSIALPIGQAMLRDIFHRDRNGDSYDTGVLVNSAVRAQNLMLRASICVPIARWIDLQRRSSLGRFDRRKPWAIKSG